MLIKLHWFCLCSTFLLVLKSSNNTTLLHLTLSHILLCMLNSESKFMAISSQHSMLWYFSERPLWEDNSFTVTLHQGSHFGKTTHTRLCSNGTRSPEATNIWPRATENIFLVARPGDWLVLVSWFTVKKKKRKCCSIGRALIFKGRSTWIYV